MDSACRSLFAGCAGAMIIKNYVITMANLVRANSCKRNFETAAPISRVFPICVHISLYLALSSSVCLYISLSISHTLFLFPPINATLPYLAVVYLLIHFEVRSSHSKFNHWKYSILSVYLLPKLKWTHIENCMHSHFRNRFICTAI